MGEIITSNAFIGYGIGVFTASMVWVVILFSLAKNVAKNNTKN